MNKFCCNFFLFLLFLTIYSKAQQTKPNKLIHFSKSPADTAYTILERPGKPPVILNTFGIITGPGDVSASFLLKSYKNNLHTHYHVIVVELKKDLEIFDIAAIYRKFKIDIADYHLPVIGDWTEWAIGPFPNLSFTADCVLNVKVMSGSDGKRYISIKTSSPYSTTKTPYPSKHPDVPGNQ